MRGSWEMKERVVFSLKSSAKIVSPGWMVKKWRIFLRNDMLLVLNGVHCNSLRDEYKFNVLFV